MTLEKWIVHPGESRVIDVAAVRALKIGLVGGQVDIIVHDEAGIRIEVHTVTVKDLRIEATGDSIEIDHPQLRWDNFLEVFRNFGAGGPRAEISVAVPRDIALNLGVVSASALVAGLENDVRLNTVSGDIIVDGLRGDMQVNAVSGDIQAHEVVGALTANSVSGDVAATGMLRKATVDTVTGSVVLDASGPVQQISVNTVNGNATIRLDEGLAANYVARSVTGRVQVDGALRSGTGPTNFAGSTGALSGSFADVRTNTVSGDVTVLRTSLKTAAVDENAPLADSFAATSAEEDAEGAR